jgi:hypothetical protein
MIPLLATMSGPETLEAIKAVASAFSAAVVTACAAWIVTTFFKT